MNKTKNNSNYFAILSIFAIGAYYTTNPELMGLADQQKPNTLGLQEQTNTKKPKPKSFVDSVSSSLFANREVTFAQWIRTPEAIEAYEKWRKSPTGIQSLIESFSKSLDFTKALEKWASKTKRNIKEFKKFALNKQTYKDSLAIWLQSDEAVNDLKNHFINDASFDTKSQSWIAGTNRNQDILDYLAKAEAKSDYDLWIKDSANLDSLKPTWKTTSDFTSKRDAWLSLQNTKDSKDNWLVSSSGQSYYQAWKSSANYQSDLITHWKTTSNYQGAKNRWIGVYANKKTLSDYKSDESLWNQKYLDYKNSQAGNLEIENNLVTKTAYINAKNAWSNQGKTTWINSDDSNVKYNAWRISASGRNALKTPWETTDNYLIAKNKWIDANHNPKSKDLWAGEEDISNEYNKWAATDAARSALIETWKNWSAPSAAETRFEYDQALVYWYATYRNEEIWVETTEGNTAYNNWMAIDANKNSFISHWHASDDYTNKKTTWATTHSISANIDAQYQTSNQYQVDLTAYENNIDTSIVLVDKVEYQQNITTGKKFFIANNDNTLYDAWYQKGVRDIFPTSDVLNLSFNAWHNQARGLDTYKASAQSNLDYQIWIYKDGETPYQSSSKYNDDLDLWSATKSNGVATYKASNQYNSDWNALLDSKFALTQEHTNKLNELKPLYSKDIYKLSNQFVADYNSWIDPNQRTEAKYLVDNSFSTDLNAYFNTDVKTLNAYKSSSQSNTDYNLYVNDIKDEDDYLASLEGISHLKLWASDFDNGKDVFKLSPSILNKITRTKETYKLSTQFKIDAKAFLKTTGNTHLDTYLSGTRLQNLYDKWNDPVGVERDPEVYLATKDFVEEINSWSGNIINGMSAFQNSTLAQSLFNRYKNK